MGILSYMLSLSFTTHAAIIFLDEDMRFCWLYPGSKTLWAMEYVYIQI